MNGWTTKKFTKKDILILAKSGCFGRMFGCRFATSEVKRAKRAHKRVNKTRKSKS